MFAAQWLIVGVALTAVPAPVNPFPRQILATKSLFRFDLRQFVLKSPAWHDCRLSVTSDGLRVKSSGVDPFFELPEIPSDLPKELVIRLRARFRTGGEGRLYWRTSDSPKWSEQQAQSFHLVHDGQWRDYQIPLSLDSRLLQLRVDPAATAGIATIALIEIGALRMHPLEIEAVETDAKQILLAKSSKACWRALSISAKGNDPRRRWTSKHSSICALPQAGFS